MKIIQILNSPNWSGASSYCVSLCKKLIERGHEVLLLTEPGKPMKKAQDLGIPLDDTIRLNHRNLGLYISAMHRMKKIFRSFKPDIISCHINEGAWMAGLISRWFHPQSVIVRTRTDIDLPKGHFINRYVHNHWTDQLIVGSLLHKRASHRILGLPDEKIDVVYGAVDSELFYPEPTDRQAWRQKHGIPLDTITIGLVARLDPVKGHEFALDALKFLASGNIPCHLVMMGYENRRTVNWLNQEIRKRNLSGQAIWLGYEENLPQTLRQLDLGLITSTGSEANSRACLEFMSTGIPVVATTVGVIPEIIIDGEHGLLVPPRDGKALAYGINRLASNSFLRLKMGKQARERVLQNFQLDRFVQLTEKSYLRAITKAGIFQQ